MNYNHHFHAGNFADVIKHLILIHIIEYNKLKNKPIVFFDSHAGQGMYNLSEHEALRTGEFITGIASIVDNLEKISAEYKKIILKFNQKVQKLNQKVQIDKYPGSPTIFAELMAPQDRLILIEKSEKHFTKLKHNLSAYKDNDIQLHQRDGFSSLPSLLPGQEKRAIILIDPAFEDKGDWQQASTNILKLLKKFAQAQIIIWYPNKDADLVHSFQQQFVGLEIEKLAIDITNLSIPNDKMNKCGLLVLNPIYQLENFIEVIKNNIPQYKLSYFKF
ncbi:23S rRNA (adenine(2030)-N(6))-methyltransferase RlmJ [Rickettsiales endosymbiont of Stachyamoeba lipophora]|uniref:23S rRNA (adenine(2030)-N(6))-methyltransferase RlmJ n=1 Tax=Rickettsiales endosymbiont of Stachyamoeba lipophora TaxID=2486578 RepID=UPI000F64912E|nr:23S rRNA (adenine(2030)-N(6))-methyltransferase RlmJ [Rickettsiales endosymbiont of Stachyamoeba lipophora]AZL15108.1 23S rRNA (adenine(2030)-N(6))-methyltransferase RlmJ [Rickettsiales endosymbiont of Stachyamoeba lipophora]